MIFTIGHSTRTLEALIELLRGADIATLADVRTIPRSRRNPQFNTETLAAAVGDRGIAYVHMRGLGGLRHPRPDSINTGWRNAGFRGYADYMQTPAFAEHLTALIDATRSTRLAIMCAEAVPWRCHRSLISDALTACGVAVEHIIGAGARQPHRLTPFAHVEGTHVTYPPPGGEPLDLAFPGP